MNHFLDVGPVIVAGLKGVSPKRLITMEEVKQHKTDEDAWTVLRGRVYNISPYIRFHPGGLSTFANHLPCALCSLKNKEVIIISIVRSGCVSNHQVLLLRIA